VYVFHHPLSVTVDAVHPLHRFIGFDVKFHPLSLQHTQFSATGHQLDVLLEPQELSTIYGKSTHQSTT